MLELGRPPTLNNPLMFYLFRNDEPPEKGDILLIFIGFSLDSTLTTSKIFWIVEDTPDLSE